MTPDQREQEDRTRLPDPLAKPPPANERRRILDTLVAARRSGDHELSNRLLRELVDLNEAEKKELENA